MSHPTQIILENIKRRISTNSVKTVHYVDFPKIVEDFPCAIINCSEEIEVYLTEYLVQLDIEINFYTQDEKESLLQLISECDAAMKGLTGVMTVTEQSMGEIDKTQNLEKTILTCSKSYIIKYTRSRGL